MRFLRQHQNITLDDQACVALVGEARLFLESGLSLAEWESLDDAEQQAVVVAARALATDRMAQLVAMLRAQSTEDLAAAVAPHDGGAALAKSALDAGVAQAAGSMEKPSFSRRVDA